MNSLTFRDQSFPLLQERSMQSLSVDLWRILQVLNIDPRFPAKIVGSFRYIVHEYPADIDLFEEYVGDSYEGTKLKTARHFQRLAQWIQEEQKKELVFLGDFKAGYDNRFDIPYGDGSHDEDGNFKGYDADNVKEGIRNLFEQGLLTKNETQEWMGKVHSKPTYSEYKDLVHTLREKAVLRWSIDDLLAGKKSIKGGEVSLEDAIASGQVVKIDLWVCMGNRYTEITAWYSLLYTDGASKRYLTEKPMKYDVSIRKDIAHFANPKLQKQMKLAKRIWLYGVLKDQRNLLIRLYPIFSSGAAKLHQIVGEMETVMSLLDAYKKISLEKIRLNIESWKMRIGTVPNTVLDADTAFKIYTELDKAMVTRNRRLIIQIVSKVCDNIANKNDLYVGRWLKKNYINPEKILASL